MSGTIDQQALDPLREALLARARADAAACVARARKETEMKVAAARVAADQEVREARRRGEAEAAAAVAIDDAMVRKQVHTLLLAARRSVYEQLRVQIHHDVAQLHDESVYRDLRETMTCAGRSLIGPNATIRDVADGCVIEAGRRRVEVTLGSLADWALDGVLAESQEWAP